MDGKQESLQLADNIYRRSIRYHTHPKFMPYPAKHVSIRGIEEERYTLIDVTKFNRGGAARILEEMEISRALFEVYEGGVVRVLVEVLCALTDTGLVYTPGSHFRCEYTHTSLRVLTPLTTIVSD